ncbi:DUF349 domain-containing protein [Chryseobacterium ginsengisoli]|uniref:DUF349 domain-containing protein n=1 Tax=Chryseobacterium ginsengisoli TaxID=363853 RepID=A0ABP9MGK8_9FLAO
MITENNLSENEENKNSNEVPQEETSENVVSHDENTHNIEAEHEEEQADVDISLADALKEMEKIINAPNAGEDFKTFNQLKEKASHYIHDEVEDKKHEYVEAGNPAENFSYEHPSQAKFSALVNIFREKHDTYQKGQEEEQKKNLEHRQSIIERLKNLYTNSEPGTNLFKSIREVKEDWSNAGQVAKSEFKILNNNYFHHLNQFYQMLDLNKEFLEQEYSHNLEKRQHIIERAKQLEHEPVIQKALNELQYLHKLWKEEAEPVSEEFREKTWEEFKEISNKIHERKSELSAAIETEQNQNLEKKNQIIAEIKKLSEPSETPNHNYWQNSIRRVEDLRSEFLKTGSVPRKLSNQNWNEFKTILRAFNTTKNTYYKSLKGSQQANLEEKLKLIQTAQDNANNEEWDIAVPLFKKLQEDWKKIGHVPKSMTNKIWDEFRDACNAFFNNYREKSNASTDNWKENYKNKKAILDELKTVTDEEGSVEKIEAIKTAWNNIGKVPRDKIAINTEFNKTLREKLRLNKINELELKEEGLSENQLTDKARKIKSQISDLEAEIVKLENNLAFFKNPSRENLLLKDTFNSIDEKKAHLETLKQNLHNIIAGE